MKGPRPDGQSRAGPGSRAKGSPAPSVVVLAAGASSRLGSPKQLELIHGKALIRRAIEAIPPRVTDVVVVLGHRSAAVRKALDAGPRVRVVVNPAHARGMSTSIKAGLRALRKDAGGVVIMLGDQPFVTRSLLEKLLRRYGATDKIVAVSDGRVVSPPVAFPRRFFHELDELEGDQGARTVIIRHASALSVVKTRRNTLADIDTKEDLRAARRLLA